MLNPHDDGTLDRWYFACPAYNTPLTFFDKIYAQRILKVMVFHYGSAEI